MIDISIVTIVFNAKANLQRTLKSIFQQEFKSYELIIIDGGSTDGTLDLIEENKERIDWWISEKDRGIFDAMNKGIAKASGKYINFLNSGDEYTDVSSLRMVGYYIENKPDIVYSNTLIMNESGAIMKYLQPGDTITWRSFWKGMVINHQSLFVRNEIMKKYELRYKLASDFDWTIDLFRRANTIQYINIPLIKYYLGGVSDKRIIDSRKETLAIVRKKFGFLFYVLAKMRFSIYNLWSLFK